MDARSKELFRDRLDAKNFKLSLETKVSQKGITFYSKRGTMYKVGQDNIMCRCLTTLETHIVLKELHEGMAKKKHFATNITIKKILDVGYWWPTLLKNTHEFYRSCDNC
jgi:hypothetical protein